MLSRLAHFCVRHRRLVLGIWIASFVGILAASGAAGTDFHTEMQLPSGQAKEVFDLLGQRGGLDAEIVFDASNGARRDEVQAILSPFFDEVAQLPGVDVSSPFDNPENQISNGGNGTVGVARLQVTERTQSEFKTLAKTIRDLGDDVSATLPDGSTLNIEYGGQVFAEFELPASEALGVVAAIIILVLAFGSVIAMGLPIGTALFG
ncbi:MAG: MMPL family transporter, partial [Ilumatobacteraceae bacterium]